MSDEDEANEASDPNNPDSDGDGLLDGEEFWFWNTSVTAVDSDLDGVWDGIEVGIDISVNGLTNVESEVEPPGDLTLVDETTNCASLSWQDFSTNEIAFIVERKQMSNSWQMLTVLPANVTNYYDYLYEPEQNGKEVVYAYRIKTFYAPNVPNGKMRVSRSSNTTHNNREEEKPLYAPIDLDQGGYDFSKALKVNDQGQALVLCSDYGEGADGIWVRWSQGQGQVLNGAMLQADMNNNGMVVATVDQGIRLVPAVWANGSGSATPLNVPQLFNEEGDPLPLDSLWGVGWVIDDSGQVYGYCQAMFDVEYETQTHSLPLFAAHHWNGVGGIPQPLGHPKYVQWGISDVSGSGTRIGQRLNKVGEDWQDHYYVGGQNVSFVPESINNAGMVAGTDKNHHTAILWQGTVQNLGGGWARGVNEEGLVVGHDHSGNQAYLWKKNDKTGEYERFTVNETLPQQQQAEWNVTEAYDVNGAEMIAGQGVNQGKEKATILMPVYEITFNAFIPLNRVPVALGFLFGGDFRSWDKNGSFRVQQTFTLISQHTTDIDGLLDNSENHKLGKTTLYLDHAPIWDGYGSFDIHDLQAEWLSDKIVKAYFKIKANPGLPTLVGAIAQMVQDRDVDCEFTLTIDSSNPAFKTYSIEGKHDGFPAYELYINNQRIYEREPQGDSSLLLDPIDITVPPKSGIIK